MGSGIAAHLAGAGIEVLLLDIVPPDGKGSRNAFAIGGKDKALKAKPAAFFTPRDADLVAVGNLEDDLDKAGKCDLVIEVVKEDLAIKRALFASLEPLLAEHTIVASNTSGLPIAQMMEGRSASMKKRFLVTHFFNPVRYMKLLELVAGPDTDPRRRRARGALRRRTCSARASSSARTRPTSSANRIGMFAMMHLIKLAIDGGYTVEEVDAIFGPPLGRPKSAVFRTADLVGLDTFIHVANNCYESLTHDEQRDVFKVPPLLDADGREEAARRQDRRRLLKKTQEASSPSTSRRSSTGRSRRRKFASVGATKGVSDVGERIRKVLAGDDQAAELARRVTYATLAYAAHRIGEIADDLVNIDRGMRWGFGWDLGPFETWDAIGVQKGVDEMEKLGITPAAWVNEMLKSGRTSFYSDGDLLGRASRKARRRSRPRRASCRCRQLRKKGGVVFENDGATLYDSAIASPASSSTPR